MKELAYSYIEFGEEYWWAFLIIWLLWIIVAHIPNFIDFHYADIIIPIIYPSGNLGYIEIVCSFQYDINR